MWASVFRLAAFPPGSLKARVAAFTFRAQGINPLEAGVVTVNGETVIWGDRLVFCAVPVFLSVVLIFTVTGAAAGFGLPERAAKLLAQASVAVGRLAVFVHDKARTADEIAGGEFLGGFGIAFVQRNESLTIVVMWYILDQVVDFFHVAALITPKVHSRKERVWLAASIY